MARRRIGGAFGLAARDGSEGLDESARALDRGARRTAGGGPRGREGRGGPAPADALRGAAAFGPARHGRTARCTGREPVKAAAAVPRSLLVPAGASARGDRPWRPATRAVTDTDAAQRAARAGTRRGRPPKDGGEAGCCVCGRAATRWPQACAADGERDRAQGSARAGIGARRDGDGAAWDQGRAARAERGGPQGAPPDREDPRDLQAALRDGPRAPCRARPDGTAGPADADRLQPSARDGARAGGPRLKRPPNRSWGVSEAPGAPKRHGSLPIHPGAAVQPSGDQKRRPRTGLAIGARRVESRLLLSCGRPTPWGSSVSAVMARSRSTCCRDRADRDASAMPNLSTGGRARLHNVDDAIQHAEKSGACLSPKELDRTGLAPSPRGRVTGANGFRSVRAFPYIGPVGDKILTEMLRTATLGGGLEGLISLRRVAQGGRTGSLDCSRRCARRGAVIRFQRTWKARAKNI
jgi:hypothetical protein